MLDLLKSLKDPNLQLLSKVDIDLKRFSSGSFLLDSILGGGYPIGRIVEIYGPESAGKTTLCLSAALSMQELGRGVAYIDTENAFNRGYAESLGIDSNKFLLYTPSDAESALDFVLKVLADEKADIGLIVLDSIASLSPNSELAGSSGDASVGVLARLMSKFMRSVAPAIGGKTLLFTNQIRMKIGTAYGNPETTPGGNAVKYAASIRLDVRVKERIKVGTKAVGVVVRVRTTKNKTFSPFKCVDLSLLFAEGFDKRMELLHLGEERNILEKKGGGYYVFKGQTIKRKDYLEGLSEVENFNELKVLCGL